MEGPLTTDLETLSIVDRELELPWENNTRGP